MRVFVSFGCSLTEGNPWLGGWMGIASVIFFVCFLGSEPTKDSSALVRGGPPACLIACLAVRTVLLLFGRFCLVHLWNGKQRFALFLFPSSLALGRRKVGRWAVSRAVVRSVNMHAALQCKRESNTSHPS